MKFPVILASSLVALSALCQAAETLAGAPVPRPSELIFDMVHHNPGEPLTLSKYEDPRVIREMGFNGKVYFLFDSPTLAVDWESVDPEIMPKGSADRAWMEKKAAQIDAQHAACKAAGVKVYAMGDLVLFPKRLIEKYKMEKTFGDPRDPQTDKFLRLLIRQMFDRFPSLDGLVVRVGETYLQDAPYHQGHIVNKGSAEKTIVPLINLLREEVCVKRNKQLIFRTWMSFDTDLKTYTDVSAAVEPHPNLVISVKHCEGDFHRGNLFSRVLGEGRHRQVVEVQCAREYEGKGAYPNYIAHGVIEGFEEHRLQMPPEKLKSIRGVVEKTPALFAGIWTWTRGGGWEGPFIKNELWCDLNAWVMAQWAADTTQSEAAIFNRYATERLGLKGDDVAKFRRLCLLSADAVLRGKCSTLSDITPWWSRDHFISAPPLPKEAVKRQRVLAEKTEAVKMWEEIVGLAKAIQFPDAATGEYVVTSSEYGLNLYRIYQIAFELADVGGQGDKGAIRILLARYDQAWVDYRKLAAEHSSCATLYKDLAFRNSPRGSLRAMIEEYRKLLE
ncbi:MAG TPA: hypothetical protein VFY13_02815 [Luteolibacter sp.]|nr:hypothetical protein [Luteolibacter sp.]